MIYLERYGDGVVTHAASGRTYYADRGDVISVHVEDVDEILALPGWREIDINPDEEE